MSKERKFHELIEQQNREEKDRVWAKIQQREAERLAKEKEKQQPVLSKVISFSWQKWVTVAASSLAIIMLGVFAIVKFFPFDLSANNSSSGEGDRYFTNQSYKAVETQDTLKDYAQSIGKSLLYFDWYAETDHLKDYVWLLNDTQEIICFKEEIIDINTGCAVFIFVTESDVILESFGSDESTDRNSVVNNIEVNWKMQDDLLYANLEYEGFKYYLRVLEPVDENYILALMEELLP